MNALREQQENFARSMMEGVDEQYAQTIKDNEAALTGTVYKDDKTGKIKTKHGLLSVLNSLVWDEGSSLLRKTNFMQDITDVFQGVMDEPGKVIKGMRLGTVDYQTHTTLVAGSYMFPEFGQTLMTKGFLQRMFLIQTILTERDKRNIRIGVNLLKTGKNFRKIDRLKEAMRILVNKIQEPTDKMIMFDNESVMDFNTILERVYKDSIEYQFVGDKQIVLETFFNRLHLLIDKIASQRAIINKKSKVELEDLKYAKSVCDIHLGSLLNMFDSVKRTHINTAQEKRRNMIVDLIKRAAGGIAYKKTLLDDLLELKKRGIWDLGYNRSKSLIEEMISKKAIHSEKSKDGEKLLIIK